MRRVGYAEIIRGLWPDRKIARGYRRHKTNRPVLTGRKQEEHRQCQRGQDRFDIDATGLMPQLSLEVLVRDLLYAVIHVARAARRQGHSGLGPRLVDADRAHGKWEKEDQPPPAVGAGHNEQQSQAQAKSKTDYTTQHTPALFRGSDILYTNGGFVLARRRSPGGEPTQEMEHATELAADGVILLLI